MKNSLIIGTMLGLATATALYCSMTNNSLKKSKTRLCEQNRRHYYVNKKSNSFILYNTNRVLNISINTRFVLLYIRFCRFNAYIGNIAHDTYI